MNGKRTLTSVWIAIVVLALTGRAGSGPGAGTAGGGSRR